MKLSTFLADKSVLPSQLTSLTESSLANCHFPKNDILHVIRNAESDNAHSHDMISIRMLKLWADLTSQSLEIIFKM